MFHVFDKQLWKGGKRLPFLEHWSIGAGWFLPRGALRREKGTNSGPTAGEGWLSPPTTAKKGGLSFYYIVG